ncbi:T-cell surface glycoprotein CD4-like isoform X2 [Mastacembelus armatus]|uniref:T-cell surface glycoprotein CD4-like isoform X2 n=1 Tax=Mastacembelus armatus TaxID=205130 RepID=UPI000E45FD5D|nr:T-cell surface glycoprotein CD4-like isoform X2 [Mastacembelus armatus]
MKIIVWVGCVLGALSASGKVFKSKAGHTALLECGHSFTRAMIWRHNSNLIISVNGKTGFFRKGQGDLVLRSSVKYVNKLEISGLKKEDAGKFICDADDKLTEHTLLVVSVWTNPSHELQLGSEAMLHCEVAGLNPGSTVQWKRPDGKLHEGSQIVKLSSVAISDSGTWVCMFSHDGSSFQEDLNLKINIPTPKIPLHTSTTESSKEGQNVTCAKCDTHPKSAFEQLNWWVWVAIGVGSLVVVLLMVLVIFLCKRTRRRKRMKMNMKNGQHLRTKQYCQCNRPTAAPKPQQGRRKEKPSALHVQPLLME